MNKVQLKRFKQLLTEKRDEIVAKAKQTLEEDMALDANDLPDEMDLASSEYLQSFTFRLRGRETAIPREDRAGAGHASRTAASAPARSAARRSRLKRLEARPETPLCIRCKEDQERLEKDFG